MYTERKRARDIVKEKDRHRHSESARGKQKDRQVAGEEENDTCRNKEMRKNQRSDDAHVNRLHGISNASYRVIKAT